MIRVFIAGKGFANRPTSFPYGRGMSTPLKRTNSPFSNDEAVWVVFEYGALRSLTAVRRKFGTHFQKRNNIPSKMAFKRLVERFEKTGNTSPPKPQGRTATPGDLIQRVRQLVKPFQDNQQSISVPLIAKQVNASTATVWRIMRKKLGWKPYKPHVSVPLTTAHKTGRREFSEWLLQKPAGFEEKVIWTDEKWLVLNTAPNKQNERFWAPENPNVTVNCREQGAQKVMCWAAVVDGQVFLHWLSPGTTVNGSAYLRLLKERFWPQVRHRVQRDRLWFQQDGATVHTTSAVRQWLAEKFGGRIVSRLTERPWPPRSPDLSPLDYWFWAVAMAELRRNPPATLEELKATVERFAGNLDPDDVRRAVRHLRQRAETCVRRKGDTVENL